MRMKFGKTFYEVLSLLRSLQVRDPNSIVILVAALTIHLVSLTLERVHRKSICLLCLREWTGSMPVQKGHQLIHHSVFPAHFVTIVNLSLVFFCSVPEVSVPEVRG